MLYTSIVVGKIVFIEFSLIEVACKRTRVIFVISKQNKGGESVLGEKQCVYVCGYLTIYRGQT